MPTLPFTILQVVPRLGAGGAERTTLEMARAIVSAGGRALVGTASGRLAVDIERAGGEIITLPVHRRDPVSILRAAGMLGRLIEKESVDLVHARSRAPAWSAGLAARRAGRPFVTTFHGIHPATSPFKRWYNSGLVRSDIVIANSRFTAERIATNYGVAGSKVRVIPRGADLNTLNPNANIAGRVNRLVENWGLENADPGVKFLLPARLTPWKGQMVAVEAVSLLKSKLNAGKLPGLTLVLCGGVQGNRDYEAALRAKIDERGVRDMVHMVGETADMPAAYCWADIVLAPSVRAEPFGRTAVEAGAMGKPVVASNHGGALETVVDRETGLFAKPGDAQELADAMVQLACDGALREKLGQQGQARVRALYSSAVMCDATLSVYRELLGNRA